MIKEGEDTYMSSKNLIESRIKRQQVRAQNRAKNADSFSMVADEVFKLCSNRINKRIEQIEKISGTKITQTQIAQSEDTMRDLDIGAVNRILNANHNGGENKSLFPVFGAKEYYRVFEQMLKFDGAYEILWGTVTEIVDYLPAIFQLLCKAEYTLEKKLLGIDHFEDATSRAITRIERFWCKVYSGRVHPVS